MLLTGKKNRFLPPAPLRNKRNPSVHEDDLPAPGDDRFDLPPFLGSFCESVSNRLREKWKREDQQMAGLLEIGPVQRRLLALDPVFDQEVRSGLVGVSENQPNRF